LRVALEKRRAPRARFVGEYHRHIPCERRRLGVVEGEAFLGERHDGGAVFTSLQDFHDRVSGLLRPAATSLPMSCRDAPTGGAEVGGGRIGKAMRAHVASHAGAKNVFRRTSTAKDRGRLAVGYRQRRFSRRRARLRAAHPFPIRPPPTSGTTCREHRDKTSAKLVAGWTEQPGYPVVKVLQRCENGAAVVTLAQERFTLNDPKAPALTWNVPVILADEAGTRRTALLERDPQELRFGRCGAMLANAGDTGYYRSQYDERNFRLLVPV